LRNKSAILMTVLAITLLAVSAGIAVAAGGTDSRGADSREVAEEAKGLRAQNDFSCRNQGEDGSLRASNSAEECSGECNEDRDCEQARIGDGSCDAEGDQVRNRWRKTADASQEGTGQYNGCCAGDCDRDQIRIQDGSCDGTCEDDGAERRNQERSQY
jgi:hypothetical protein